MNNLLEENFSVVNKSDETMIFGVGGHPGFNLPVILGKRKKIIISICIHLLLG